MATQAEGELGKLKQQAIEQFTEDESLRSGLTDDEAKILLDWGVARLESASAKVQAQDAGQMAEALEGEVKQLKGAGRAIADLVGSGDLFSPQQLLDELKPYLPKLSGLARLLSFFGFGQSEVADQIARERETLTNEEMICRLISFVEKGK